LGHALFPWSAFVPVAIGRLLRPPPGSGAAAAREGAVRVALLVTAGVALAAFAFVAPRAGNVAFSGPTLLAAIAALAVFDLERGAPPSRALGLTSFFLAVVLFFDFFHEQDRALACFVVDRPAFPKSFESKGDLLLFGATAAFTLVVALAWLEEQPAREGGGVARWARALAEKSKAAVDEIAEVWQGNLAFALTVIEAGFVGLGAMIFVGERVHWAAVERLPRLWAKVGLALWWAVPLAIALAPLAYVVLRDGFRLLVDKTRTPRAAWTLVAGLAAGAVLSFGYFPALAAQVSPKEVFETYAKVAQKGDELGLLGVRARAASYYSGTEVQTLVDAQHAFEWLTEEPNARRFLVFKAEDLPRLNSLFRKATGKNVPVIDARSSQILLASNRLDGSKNENPLADVVLDDPPAPAHPVDASFEDQIDALGWDVLDANGKKVDVVVPSTRYRLRFYYRVVRPVSGGWKAFVHIDGNQRRYNGDHMVCDGRYPMNLWQPGDVIADELDFQLEPNFTPGDYTVFFGFFMGETRFRVTRGPQHENRVDGGPIAVR
ncbi:MAG TPA: hypothetical protein VHB21_25755, partial [Minicystis sp.]|nr:hypothetical protein [Minicystis sp.]